MAQKYICTYCEKEVDETADYYAIAHYPLVDDLGPIRAVDEVDVFCSAEHLKAYATTMMP